MKLITTSWDDGHPLDFKLAELLDKYNLKGTFYIPRSNDEHEVMNESEVKLLSKSFEIGGHTLSHLRLSNLSCLQQQIEIKGCYTWLNDVLGSVPESFCFPGGALNKKAITCAFNAGFKVLRTTELLSIATNEKNIIPTTLQILEHKRLAYLKNLIKRKRFNSLTMWLQSYGNTQLLKILEYYLNKVEQKGGCLHIWGHSWEIEEHALWKKLELIFKHISNLPSFEYVYNKNIAELNNN